MINVATFPRETAGLSRPGLGARIVRRIEQDIRRIGGHIQTGTLKVSLPTGAVLSFGAGAPKGEVTINDWGALTALWARGDVGWGEAYVAGLWDSPCIESLAAVTMLNRQAFEGALTPNLAARLAFRLTDRIFRRNNKAGSSRNIRAHYDVGDEFYRLWLDDSMTYSSALFAGGDDDLGRAQDRKCQRLLEMTAGAGSRLLEIGCGWGGFAEAAAEAGRDVVAITVSPAQHAYAARRLGDRADIRLQDYRDVKGQYDAIVSVEMIEAVGERYWPRYFKTIAERLNKDGKAALQAIVVDDAAFPKYRARSDYIRQYTFPGGMLPSPGEIEKAATNAGLEVFASFSFAEDYARTLRIWLATFETKLPEIRALGYDDKFIRSWRYYLAICAATFAYGQTDVIHIGLQHKSDQNA